MAGLASLALVACSPRQLVIDRLADELASQSSQAESDWQLARDAAPFYLKLSESVLAQRPEHRRLAESVAAGFTQYSYAFVVQEADRLESRDAKAAEQLRRRAAALYRRAHLHAMRALTLAYPGLPAALAEPASRLRLPAADVGLAYWAAAAWGGWISLSKDDPEVVADLPLAVSLADLAWRSDPDWGQGSLTSLRATFEAARPGGRPDQALAWFDQAIAQSAGQNAGVFVAKAESWALPAGERAAFEALLQRALSITLPPDSPQAQANANALMQTRAAWLLQQADDLF